MIIQVFFCGIILTCHCLLTSGFIISQKKPEVILKDPREYEYISKRTKEDVNDQESKERRSNMGSLFVRFGKSEKQAISDLEHSRDYSMDHPQTRSDVIIRYGRAEKKSNHKLNKLRKSDLQLIRFGRRAIPIDIDLTLICEDFLINEESYTQNSIFHPSQLAQICNNLEYKQIGYNDDRLDLKQE